MTCKDCVYSSAQVQHRDNPVRETCRNSVPILCPTHLHNTPMLSEVERQLEHIVVWYASQESYLAYEDL